MFKLISGLFSNDISIDLGTANTLIYVKDRGIVLNEPSVVAIKVDDKSIVAIGQEAKQMLGRVPDKFKAIRPMRDGVIADFEITEKMLQYFIRAAHEGSFFKPSPRVLVCVPCGSTKVERKVIRESATGAGARQVHLIEEPLAAAIGAGLPVEQAHGSMVVDIGGGTTEIAVISLNGTVYSQSTKIAGDHMDESIIRYIRRKYGIAIGESTAENIKKTIGVAFIDDTTQIKEMEIRGRNITEGVPHSLILRSQEVLEALQESLQGIVIAVRAALEATPPELAADIIDQGIVLTGGGALIRNLDRLISSETGGLRVRLADDPLTCVARGGGIALEWLDKKGIDVFVKE
jgi:rod shape-determining protein MreB